MKGSAKAVAKTFSAPLVRAGNNLNWVVVTLPFDSVKLWGVRAGLRVKGDINGFPFQTSLFPTGDGRHYLVVNKVMQRGGGAMPGDIAAFRLEPDLEKRTVPAQVELDRVLKTSRSLRKFFDSLSPSVRSDLTRLVGEAKQEETRVRRAEQVAERLMETMEAEIELPPLLKQEFLRQPGVLEAWRRMPPSHRRRHLLGIFYYRNFDARMRRIEKALAEIVDWAEGRGVA